MSDREYADPWHCIEASEDAADAVRMFCQEVRYWRGNFLSAYHRLAELYEREFWDSVYSASELYGTEFAADARGWIGDSGERRTPSDNFTKAIIDTISSRLFGEIPRLHVATLGGDYMARLQARRKTWALTSTLDDRAAREVMGDARMDALKTGFGAVMPEVANGSFRLIRVPLDNIWWHPLEARDHRRPADPPRSMHVSQWISKGQACEMVKALELSGDEEERILHRIAELPPPSHQGNMASSYDSPYDRYITQTISNASTDMVAILRSIHLPSAVGAEDGRELVQVTAISGNEPSDEGVAIFDGEWTHETHPVVWWAPYPVHQGLLGIGFGATVEPFQRQHDWAWQTAERLIKDWGIPNVAIPEDMDTNEQKTNIAGSQSVNFVTIPGMRAGGKPYEILQHHAQGPELLNWIQTVPQTAHAAVGLNQGVAQGMTKLGANASGAALSAEDTRADIRFASVLEQADSWHVAVGQETLNALDRGMEADLSFAVRFSDQWEGQHDIPWTELRMSSGAYDVRIEQLGALGRTASARLRSIQELGAVAPDVASTALRATFVDHDLPSVAREANADQEYVEGALYYLALYADTKENRAEKLAPYWPDEVTDLDIAERLSRHELQRAMRTAEQPVIDTLTEYRARVQAMRAEQQPPAPAPMMPGMSVDGAGIEPAIAPEMMPGVPPGMPIQ